jgi:hypothetical protein
MKLQFVSKILLLIVCISILISLTSILIAQYPQGAELHQVWTDQGTQSSSMQPWIEVHSGKIGKWHIAGTITLKNGDKKSYNAWGFISPITVKYWGFKAEDRDMISANLQGEYSYV